MPLAEYLASEQARDRLKTADVLTMPSASEWHGHGQRVVIEQCEEWWRVSVTIAEETISAYYRPDGDRFVVTDLGEGVRALRLRTGCSHYKAMERSDPMREALRTSGIGNVWSAERGLMELDNVTPFDLPDAICRVMLASLKVSEVQP